MDKSTLILAFTTVVLLLYLLNARVLSPVIAIFSRWARWILFALTIAFLATVFEWSNRPFEITASIAFLTWFLIESIYNWLAIRALSHSPLPLFPRFAVNTNGDEWPAQRRLLAMRDWLRAENFSHIESLKAEIAPGVFLRVSIYQDPTHTTRLQITFIPQINGAITVCCTIATETDDGVRYVTDNLHLPFGGFYPEAWRLERRPWNRHLPALMNFHRKRLKGLSAFKVWETDPLDDLNRQQSELEKLNTRMGFLLPHNERDEHGKLTPEGRYRVWKEVWLLNYLGRSVRYW